MAILKTPLSLTRLLSWSYAGNVGVGLYLAISLLFSCMRLHPPSNADVIISMGTSGLDSSQTAQLLLQRERCLARALSRTPLAVNLNSIVRNTPLWQTQSRLVLTQISPAVSLTAQACRTRGANAETEAPGAAFSSGKDTLIAGREAEDIHAGSTVVQAVTSPAERRAARRPREREIIFFAEGVQVLSPSFAHGAEKGGFETRRTSVTDADTSKAKQKVLSRTSPRQRIAVVRTNNEKIRRAKGLNRRRYGSARRRIMEPNLTKTTFLSKQAGRIALGVGLAGALGTVLQLYCIARASRLQTLPRTPPGRGLLQKLRNLKGFPAATVIFHGPPREEERGTPTFDREMLESFAVLHAGENCVSLSGQEPFAEIVDLMQEAANAHGEHLDKQEAVRLIRKVQDKVLKVAEGDDEVVVGGYSTLKQLKEEKTPFDLFYVFRGFTRAPWKMSSTGNKEGLVSLAGIRDELRPYGNSKNRCMVELTLPDETEADAPFDKAYAALYENALLTVMLHNKVFPEDRLERIRIPLLMHKGSRRDEDHLARLAVEGIQSALAQRTKPEITVEFEGDKANTFYKAALEVEKYRFSP